MSKMGSMSPLWKRPELLIHPNIPKPLHGVNPRTVMGARWWKKARLMAMEMNNHCCYACGLHTIYAYKQRLEAHEAYDVDDANATATFREVVGLCRKCHNFIHSGMIFARCRNDELSHRYVLSVYNRGFKLLREANIRPCYSTANYYLLLTNHTRDEAIEILKERDLMPPISYPHEWRDWRLIVDGKEYFSRYDNYEEWESQYK